MDGLTLLVRAYCHLCDDMRVALEPIAREQGLPIREIDVDADPALEARWGELVPVLLWQGRELCHFRLDRLALDRLALGRTTAATVAGGSDFG